MGAISIVWTVLLVALNPAQNLLGDSITAIGLAIAYYYGFTGLASAWYFRRELRRSAGVLLRVGLLPLAGGLAMFAVFGKAFHDYSLPAAGYAKPLLGIQIPIVIGIGALLLGVPVMLLARLRLRAFSADPPKRPPRAYPFEGSLIPRSRDAVLPRIDEKNTVGQFHPYGLEQRGTPRTPRHTALPPGWGLNGAAEEEGQY